MSAFVWLITLGESFEGCSNVVDLLREHDMDDQRSVTMVARHPRQLPPACLPWSAVGAGRTS
jgi:hypothetical protein